MGSISNHSLFSVIPFLGICEVYIITSSLLDTFHEFYFLINVRVGTMTRKGAAIVGVARGEIGVFGFIVSLINSCIWDMINLSHSVLTLGNTESWCHIRIFLIFVFV